MSMLFLTNALSVIAQICLITVTSAVWLYFAGFGISRLLLPSSFKSFEWFCTPIVGFAWSGALAYHLLYKLSLTLPQATLAIVVLSALVNMLALRDPANRELDLHWNETKWYWLFAAGMFSLSVLPLLRYGFLTVIGDNWDVEFYLPVADYLKTYSPFTMIQAPANPVKELAVFYLAHLPLASSYLNGIISFILARRAIDTYAVMIAVWRALSLLSVAVFFRVTLRMNSKPSLFALILVGLNGSLLWVTFNNFEMQIAGLALLPLALASTVEWFETFDWRTTLLAALLAAALFLTYNPAFMLWGLAVGVFFFYQLATHNRKWELIRSSLLLGLIAILIAAPSFEHVQGIYDNFYGINVAKIGLRRFVGLDEIYGLAFFRINPINIGKRIGYTLGDILYFIQSATTYTLMLFSAFFLFVDMRSNSARRRLWFALILPYVSLLLAFVFVLKNQYGYFKSTTMVFFVFAALASQGLWHMGDTIQHIISNRQPTRLIWLSVTSFLVILLTLFNAGLQVEPRIAGPSLFTQPVIELNQLNSRLKPQASIYLTKSDRLAGILMGEVGYFLLDHPTFGNVDAGFSKMENSPQGHVQDYGLFYFSENPRDYGYTEQPIWSNDLVNVSPRVSDIISHFDLNQNVEAKDELFPLYPESSENHSLALTVSTTTVTLTDSTSLPQSGSPYAVGLNVASLVPTDIELADSTTQTVLSLTPGLNTITTSTTTLPTLLKISNNSSTPIYLSSVEVFTTGAEHPTTAIRPNVFLLQTDVVTQNVGFKISLDNVSHTAGSLEWALDIRGLAKGTGIGIHFARCSYTMSGSHHVELVIRLDSYDCVAMVDSQSLSVQSEDYDRGDGRFSLYFGVFEHGQVLQTLELGTFRITNDRITNLVSKPVPMALFSGLRDGK